MPFVPVVSAADDIAGKIKDVYLLPSDHFSTSSGAFSPN